MKPTEVVSTAKESDMQPAVRINRQGTTGAPRKAIQAAIFTYPLNDGHIGNTPHVELARRGKTAGNALFYAAGLVVISVTASAGLMLVYQSFADFAI
jgi:hypothetical protein